MQKHGARLLGFTKDPSVGGTLINLLRTSNHASVKSEAAEALARLGVRHAVHNIEQVLQDEPASGYIKALADFREPSSLQLILEGVNKGPGQFYDDYLEALGAFCRLPQGREAVEAQINDWPRAKLSLFDDQTPLVVGLLRYEPSALLTQACRLLDNGQFTTRARAELAKWIPFLSRRTDVDKALLMQVVKILVCDHRVTIRELAIQSLRQVGVRFCRQLYADVTSSNNTREWDRACAVQVKAIYEDDLKQIESARYDKEFLVRRAADEALVHISRRAELSKHIEQFITSEGLEKMSAYLCLEQQGDMSTLQLLDKRCRLGSLSFTFLRSLTSSITNRLEKEYKDRQEKEDKLDQSRGTIWFD
jgi:hypothetical protein